MARSHARVYITIWADPDFRALSVEAQRLFLFLISQPDMTNSGVIAIRPRRWASGSAKITPADIIRALTELAEHGFVLVDDDTEECLVRSFMRWDRVWRQPNIAISVAAQIRTLTSVPIRAALRAELLRITVEPGPLKPQTFAEISALHDALIGELAGGIPEVFANPSANPSPKGSPKAAGPAPVADPVREDVERLCAHLAERIEGNGSKRPVITKAWRDATRLMLDKDGRTETQIRAAIDWCQNDEFWRGNVLSMPKLREQYDRLRLAAHRNGGGRATTDDKITGLQALKEPEPHHPVIPGSLA